VGKEIPIPHGNAGFSFLLSFHPNGLWLATSDEGGLVLWPLARSYAAVIRGHDEAVLALTFGPRGRWLASSGSGDGTVKVWPLDGDVPSHASVSFDMDSPIYGMAASPDGERIVVSTHANGVQLLSPHGESRQSLPGDPWGYGVAFSPDGRLAACLGQSPGGPVGSSRISIWDVPSGKAVTVLESEEQLFPESISFTPDGRLLSLSESGLIRWDLSTGESKLLRVGSFGRFAASADGRRVLIVDYGDRRPDFTSPGRAMLLDLETGAASHLVTHGNRVLSVALDLSGNVAVTGDVDGIVRVGPVSGEEPHLLPGHEDTIYTLAVDPNGRWIASGGGDRTVRLWPMPDLSEPPLHTLPREELIAKLKTLTNLRVVRDEESTTGWKLTHDPFPGWETVPTW